MEGLSYISMLTGTAGGALEDESLGYALRKRLTDQEYATPFTLENAPVGFYGVSFDYLPHAQAYSLTFVSDETGHTHVAVLPVAGMQGQSLRVLLDAYAESRDDWEERRDIETMARYGRPDMRRRGTERVQAMLAEQGVQVESAFAEGIFRVMAAEREHVQARQNSAIFMC